MDRLDNRESLRLSLEIIKHMMTKKDYNAIADVILTHRNKDNEQSINSIAIDLSYIFKASNPNFDYQKWFDYLNIKPT